MIRFLFLATLIISNLGMAATVQGFGDEHFYPMADRARGIKSQNLLLTGAILSAAAYNKQYTLTEDERLKKDNHHKIGEDLGGGVFSGAIIATQFIFDDDVYNSQSHLRGLVYNVSFVFGLKALLKGRWPGANYQYQSFPSVHTSIAFMTATSLTYAYGWPAAIIAYPAAAFVGYSRLGYDCSRLSDVIVGATIGAWIGRASYYENADAAKDLRLQKNPKLTSLEVIPILTSNQFGTVVYYSF